MKTINLKNGNPITIFDDGTINFIELCQALGADPGETTNSCTDILINDPTNGYVIKGESLPEFILRIDSTNPQVKDIVLNFWNQVLKNAYAAYSAAQEDTATSQKRSIAQMSLNKLDTDMKLTQDAIDREQHIIDNSAPKEGEVLTGPEQVRRQQNKSTSQINLQRNLGPQLAKQQKDAQALKQALKEMGATPDNASNFILTLFGGIA